MAVWTCEAFEAGMVDIHGFLSQGYLHSDNNNFYADTEEGTFQFNEFSMNFSSDLTDKLRIGLQLLSRDLGKIGNNTVELDWAYGTYRWKDWLGFVREGLSCPWDFTMKYGIWICFEPALSCLKVFIGIFYERPQMRRTGQGFTEISTLALWEASITNSLVVLYLPTVKADRKNIPIILEKAWLRKTVRMNLTPCTVEAFAGIPLLMDSFWGIQIIWVHCARQY
jgi:hypothetical protein